MIVIKNAQLILKQNVKKSLKYIHKKLQKNANKNFKIA